MAIRCGSCKDRHDTVAEVRACYGQVTAPVQTEIPVQATPAQPAPQVTNELMVGYFVVRFEDTTHMTFCIDRQDEDDKFMPGRLIVAYQYGPDNEVDYKRIGHVADGRVVIWKKHRDNERLTEAVKVLVGDPHAAQKAYVQESGNCAKCGRLLTASAGELYGPICAGKVAAGKA